MKAGLKKDMSKEAVAKREYMAKWREQHREQIRAYDNLWKENNPEKVAKWNAKWRAENPEKIAALRRYRVRPFAPKVRKRRKPNHGTCSEYRNNACRCKKCIKANTEHMRIYRQEKKSAAA